MASIEHRDGKGRACSAEEAARNQDENTRKAAEEAAAENIQHVQAGLTPEEAAAIPTSVWEKIQAGMASMLSGPVVSTLYGVNKDSAVLATRLRVGRMINDKVRGSVLRNVLPESMHPLMLENKLGAALTDLGLSNLVMALAVMFGDKLPGNMGRYLMILGRCSTTAAYLDGVETIHLEKMIDQFISKDMMKLLGDAEAAGA